MPRARCLGLQIQLFNEVLPATLEWKNGQFDWITSAPLAPVGVSACLWDVLDRASGPSRSPRLPGEAKSHYEAPARSSSAPSTKRQIART